MIKFPPKTIAARFRLAVETFRADGRGIAATEFAMIVPLMLLLVFGTIEITNGLTVGRKVTVVTRTLSDITSRAKSVSDTDINSFFVVGNAIMQPYSSTPLVATITEILIDPNTSAGRVQWSKTQGGKAMAAGDTIVVPAGPISKDSNGKVTANQYLIYSEVNYNYKPTVAYIMDAKVGITLKDSTFTRPRESACVMYPPPSSNVSPPCPTS